MKPALLVAPNLRNEHDIDLLEHCTSFLHFFEKVKQDDVDGLDAHRRACRVLKYINFKKGDLVFKFDDLPNDFFIVLKGEVGVFTPREYMDVKREQVFLDKISKSINKPVINEDDLKKYTREKVLERKEQDFILNLRSIVDGIVYYKQDYLLKKLGGMSKSDFDNSLVFNDLGLIKFDLVCRLKEGSMFGELALIYNQPRLATIISLCDADMATMDRRNF